MTRWSLRRRLALTCLAGSLLLVAALVAALLALVNADRARTASADTVEPLARANRNLIIGLLNQETGVRGFALTGQADFLGPYQDGRSDTDTSLSVLPRLAEGFGDTVPEDVQRVAENVRAWQQSYAEPVVAAVRARGPGAADVRSPEDGRRLFDQVRVAYSAVQDDVDRAREQSRRDIRDSIRILGVLLVLAAVGSVVVVALLLLALRRWVTAPIERIGADVRQVAAGDLTHPVDTRGPRELTGLAADVESMRRRMIDDVRVAVDAREEVMSAQRLLAAQAEELARSNTDLEQFAYVASHDLQEPLRKVVSFSQKLESHLGPDLDDRSKIYLGFAVDGARRMQQLISDLLEFSRVGRRGGAMRVLPLAEPVHGALANLSGALEDSGASVEVGDLPEVEGDPALLTQLFQNLLGNAVKFRSPERTPTVRISASEDGPGGVCVEVADNGIGIGPQYADKIFVIFQRLHAREDYPGTGIGLALCKKIVEFHGGSITVDPEREQGTAFVLRLPYRQAGTAADQAPVEAVQ